MTKAKKKTVSKVVKKEVLLASEIINQKIEVKQESTKVSKEAFFAAIHVYAGFDIINFGKLQKSTYQKASNLAIELEQAYNDHC